jgi:hypothetical protein
MRIAVFKAYVCVSDLRTNVLESRARIMTMTNSGSARQAIKADVRTQRQVGQIDLNTGDRET